MTNHDIVECIYSFLSDVENPQNFVFEILENDDISYYDTLVEFVDRIHELGGKISIDDFGSGYSNLQHLMSIHSDFIKIDGSIIRQCCESNESENLIALIAGWKNISSREVKIVAEYALQDVRKPIGISEYELTKALPEHIKGQLPGIKELEHALSDHG